MIKIVVLVLSVWNCDTGVLLEEHTVDFSQRFAISGNPIEDCRVWGVREGKRLAMKYRAGGILNASSNVNCHWEERLGAPA